MKKLFYIVLLVVILMVAAHFAKNYQSAKNPGITAVEDVVTVEENGITDDSGDAIGEIIEEDIVEENPDATADDHETIIIED